MHLLNKLGLFLLIVLTACSTESELVLPVGTIEATGTFTPVPLSVYSKGTHKFSLTSTGAYIARSSVLNLRSLENKLVTVRGEAKKDSDYTLDVQELLVITEEPVKKVHLPTITTTIEVPDSWRLSSSGSSYSFYALHSILPVLTVEQKPVTIPLSANEMVINNQKFYFDQISDTRIDGYVVLNKAANILFSFTSTETDPLFTERTNTIIQSIHFIGSVTNASSSSSISTSGAVIPTTKFCGGVAGILCEPGFYCNITDQSANSGICTVL